MSVDAFSDDDVDSASVIDTNQPPPAIVINTNSDNDNNYAKLTSLIKKRSEESLKEANAILKKCNDEQVLRLALAMVLEEDTVGYPAKDSSNDSGISNDETESSAAEIESDEDTHNNSNEDIEDENATNVDGNSDNEKDGNHDNDNQAAGENDDDDDEDDDGDATNEENDENRDRHRRQHETLLDTILTKCFKLSNFQLSTFDLLNQYLGRPTIWQADNLACLAGREKVKMLPEKLDVNADETLVFATLESLCRKLNTFLEHRTAVSDRETKVDEHMIQMADVFIKIFKQFIEVGIRLKDEEDCLGLVLSVTFKICVKKADPPRFYESRPLDHYCMQRNYQPYRNIISETLAALAKPEMLQDWQLERKQTAVGNYVLFPVLSNLQTAMEATSHNALETCSCNSDPLSYCLEEFLWDTLADRFSWQLIGYVDIVTQLVVKHPTYARLDGIIGLYPMHYNDIPFQDIYKVCLAVYPSLLIKLLGTAIQFNAKEVSRENALAMNDLVVREKLDSGSVADAMKTLMVISHNNASLLQGCGEGYYDTVIRSNCPTLWQEVGSILKCVGIQSDEEASRVSNIMIGGCQLISDKVHVNYILNQMKAIAVVQPDAIRRQEHWIKAQMTDKKTKGNAKALWKALSEESVGETTAALKSNQPSTACQVM